MPDATTLPTLDLDAAEAHARPPELALTVVLHPELARIGGQARFPHGAMRIGLGRERPVFAHAEQPRRSGPLAHRGVSRDEGAVIVDDAGAVRVDGRRLTLFVRQDTAWVPVDRASAEAVSAGDVVIDVGRRVLLHAQHSRVQPVHRTHGLLGVSDAIGRVHGQIAAYAAQLGAGVPRCVLVTGESGVGKELVARALHAASPVSGGPFVDVNASTLTAQLAASRLFGHERGAFTGAVGRTRGYFREAHGGVLFLDEIGACPIDVQPQLLRALENGRIESVGAARGETVAVAVVAATHEDLLGAIESGRFRADLYYRLQVLAIRVPPLRERRVDVPVLVRHFLAHAPGVAGRLVGRDPWITAGAMRALLAHPWSRGNAREVSAFAVRLAARQHEFETVTAAAVGALLGAPTVSQARAAPRGPAWEDVLAAHGFAIGPAARALGVGKDTLRQRIAAHPELRQARDVPRAELVAVLAEVGGDLVAAARRLRVSAHALRIHAGTLDSGGAGG